MQISRQDIYNATDLRSRCKFFQGGATESYFLVDGHLYLYVKDSVPYVRVMNRQAVRHRDGRESVAMKLANGRTVLISGGGTTYRISRGALEELRASYQKAHRCEQICFNEMFYRVFPRTPDWDKCKEDCARFLGLG